MNKKKDIEAWVLAECRKVGVPIPKGETPGEEPDFRFGLEADNLGIELSEIMRPASSNNGIMPVAEENYQQEIMVLAEKQYSGPPVKVSVYFTDSRGQRRDRQEMAEALTDFVEAKTKPGNLFATKTSAAFKRELPAGFSSIVIQDGHRPWWSGAGGSYTVTDIREQLALRIEEKNKLLPSYRAHLPPGAPVWLLLYSLPSVARGMEIPHGIEEWTVPFEFERVFWWVSYVNRFVEIRRDESANSATA